MRIILQNKKREEEIIAAISSGTTKGILGLMTIATFMYQSGIVSNKLKGCMKLKLEVFLI